MDLWRSFWILIIASFLLDLEGALNMRVRHGHGVQRLSRLSCTSGRVDTFIAASDCDTCIGTINKSQLISRLQKASNGFDIRGIADISVMGKNQSLDGLPLLSDELAFWIGVGFGRYLKARNCGLPTTELLRVGIGRDCRASGVSLSAWFAGGLHAVGLTPFDTGMCTTPSMYLSCNSQMLNLIQENNTLSPWPFHGAVSVTASHLPGPWNGFKFFTPDHPTNIGEEGIAAIIDHVKNDDNGAAERIITPIPYRFYSSQVFLPVYSKFLKYTVLKIVGSFSFNNSNSNYHQPLTGLKICVNAGNGCGGFLADTLSDLGADTSSSIHLDPDGRFPNHIANPEDSVAISTTAMQVATTGADLGICLDCDADRVGLIDGGSAMVDMVINRNKLIALVATIAFKGQSSDVNESTIKTIVTDSATSNSLTRYIQDTLGGQHVRYKKGYRFVIEKARSIDGCLAAVECSGHGAWRDNGWVDDGCYTAVRILAEICKTGTDVVNVTSRYNKSLATLIKDYADPVESHEFRLKRRDDCSLDMQDLSAMAIAVFESVVKSQWENGWSVEPVNHEGLRVNFLQGRGWAMLRPSLHEPILGLHIESEIEGGIQQAVRMILFGSDCGSAGLSSLSDVLNIESMRQYL